jgi:preprotein translocase subunit SecD
VALLHFIGLLAHITIYFLPRFGLSDGTMSIRPARFNIIFPSAASLLLLVLLGCASTSNQDKFATLRLHLETNRDKTDKTQAVPIYRAQTFLVNVESSPFVTEANISEARIIESMGGFAIELKFERRGRWLLENASTANRGKRCAIHASFKDPNDKKHGIQRWLAAPVLAQPISNGVLTFTPDASREEAEQLVLGLNKLAKKLESRYSW